MYKDTTVKELINQCEYVSFDIFDTAILRPFYNPQDLWKLLDCYLEPLYQTNISFAKMRFYSEKIARKEETGKEDVTLDEIYVWMNRIFQLPLDICSYMKEKECDLEILFATKRKYIYDIYMYARKLKKKIVFISDMYMDPITLEIMLKKTGYDAFQKLFVSSQYGVLKKTGNLYKKVLQELNIKGENILHIGDNEESDIRLARENGFLAFYVPKTMDVFNNEIQELDTNNCSALAAIAANRFVNTQFEKESIGYGAMISLVANHFFDNPFVAFKEKSEINGNPEMLGYYLMGMYLMGIIKWIVENISLKENYYEKIVFLSRDGWLIKKAYDIYREYDKSLPPSEYMFASRQATLSMQILLKIDLFDLPIEYWKYSPKSLLELLKFCATTDFDEHMLCFFKKNNIEPEETFKDFSDYIKFLSYFIQNKYNSEMHNKSNKIIEKYFSGLNRKSIIFDMGYSGRVQRALARCAGEGMDVLFLYSDSIRSFDMKRKGKFNIHTFYDFIPNIAGIIREYLFSDVNATCSGYTDYGEKIEPQFQKGDWKNWDIKTIVRIQNSAIEFVKDFMDNFGGYMDFLPYKSHEVVLPLEGWLQVAPEYDRAIFKDVYSEDDIYGRNSEINMSRYLKNEQKKLPKMKDIDKTQKKLDKNKLL